MAWEQGVLRKQSSLKQACKMTTAELQRAPCTMCMYTCVCVCVYIYVYILHYIIYIHKQYLETCIWKRIMHFLQCLPVWAGENVDPSMFAPSSNKQLSGQHRCRPLLVLPASDPKICISSLAQAQCGKANLAFHLSGSSELLAWSCGLVLADCTSLPNPMVRGGTQLWPAGAEVRTLRAFPYQGFVKAASRSALNMFQPRDTEGQRKRFYHEPIQQVSLPDRPFAQWFSLNFAFCYSVLLSLDPKPWKVRKSLISLSFLDQPAFVFPQRQLYWLTI